MKNIIEISHLTKNYGKHRGVSDVSFCVQEGDIFGLVGSNGAGKSTTIRSMLGFLRFEGGDIRIMGKDIRKNHNAVLQEVGYMPSEAMFYPSMKVKEIIRLSADVRKTDCRAEAKRLCERLRVDPEKRIRDLSLGNRKKVSIVCAMQHRPKLLLLDEPTSGLDPLMQTEFFGLVREYVAEGATCMLSTHVLPEIKKYCQNIAIMRDGKLLCVDSVANISKTNAKRVRVTRDEKPEEFLFEGDLNSLIKELASHNISELLIEEPTLDEIFMHFYHE